jgi:hypothetical protein
MAELDRSARDDRSRCHARERLHLLLAAAFAKHDEAPVERPDQEIVTRRRSTSFVSSPRAIARSINVLDGTFQLRGGCKPPSIGYRAEHQELK